MKKSKVVKHRSVLSKLLATEAESFKGKLLLLVLDKLLIGAIIALAFFAYDRYRTSDQQRFESGMVKYTHDLELERRNQEAVREDRAAKIQREFERARLAKELLPLILDNSTDVVARGYVLRSALSTGLIGPEAAIEISKTLHKQGIPDIDIHRIARAAFPDGFVAIARHGARLRDEWIRLDHHPKEVYLHEMDVQKLPSKSAAVAKERRLWRAVILQLLPEIGDPAERQLFTRSFLRKHLSSLYFLLPNNSEPASTRLFQHSSRTLRLFGSLDCIIHDWGPLQEAVRYLGGELSALDLKSLDDISYARSFVQTLSLYGQPWAIGTPADGTEVASEVSVHLAALLVDGSFNHFVPWIEDGAPIEERQKWFAERDAADAHASLQYEAGELLSRIGGRARNAESVLVSFLDRFLHDVDVATTQDSVSLVRSRYGKHSVRFAIAVLGAINTPQSNVAIRKLKELPEDKLRAFEGIRMELEALEQKKTKR
jgi:hypothetical protein